MDNERDRCYVTRCFFFWSAPAGLISVGESARIVGDVSCLGSWDYTKAPELVCGKESLVASSWFSSEPVYLELGRKVEYKYVILKSDGTVKQWESGSNRSIVPTGIEMSVEDDEGMFRLSNSGSELPEDAQPRNSTGAIEAQLDALNRQEVDQERVTVFASMHLPVKIVREHDKLVAHLNVHASMYPLFSSKTRKFLFVGLCGFSSTSKHEQEERDQLLASYRCLAVEKTAESTQGHDFHAFKDFCEKYLWLLMNNTLSLKEKLLEPDWSVYRSVNRIFASAIASASTSSTFWINDFHLMLCPAFLRALNPNALIGTFMHTSFPSSESFMTLPVRLEIVSSLLCSNLLGFQFFEYARHFLTCAAKLLGLKAEYRLGGFLTIETGVDYGAISVGSPSMSHALPVACLKRSDSLESTSIHVSKSVTIRVANNSVEFSSAVEQAKSAMPRAAELRSAFPGKILIVGVDKSGKLAGVSEKLSAFRLFLQTYPQHANKVVFIQWCLSADEGLVNQINSEFGNLHMLRAQEDRTAVLVAGDVFLDCSLRDGLNLIPLEFLAAKSVASESPFVGRMIVSEGSGVSQVLNGAVRVNPWNQLEIASALDAVIGWSPSEAQRRLLTDIEFARTHTQFDWADQFIKDLLLTQQTISDSFGLLKGVPRRLNMTELVDAFRVAKKPVFFLDNEGTLTASSAGLASRGHPPTDGVLRSIKKLVDSGSCVVILSGRGTASLDKWFGSERVALAAEHGFFLKSAGETSWRCLLSEASLKHSTKWKAVASELISLFVKQVPRSFLESKGSALVWQYRDAEAEYATAQAKELYRMLAENLKGFDVEVTSGKGYVEARLRGVNKGAALARLLSEISSDFVFCAGDDQSDESMFQVLWALRPGTFTVTVGKKKSAAEFYVPDAQAVCEVLEALCQ